MKYVLFTVTVTVTALLLYAATQTMNPTPSLNQIMTPEDQVLTGVDKLTPEERSQLEEWLQEYTQVKAQTNARKKSTASPSKQSFGLLAINAVGGRYLILTDSSVWEVAPEDIYTSSAWLAAIPFEITYDSSDLNDPYPYTLKNQYSGQSVHARQSSIDEIPEAPPIEMTVTPEQAKEMEQKQKSLEDSIHPSTKPEEDTHFSNLPPPPRTQPTPNKQQQTNPNEHTTVPPGTALPTTPPTYPSESTPDGAPPSFSVTTPTQQ